MAWLRGEKALPDRTSEIGPPTGFGVDRQGGGSHAPETGHNEIGGFSAVSATPASTEQRLVTVSARTWSTQTNESEQAVGSAIGRASRTMCASTCAPSSRSRPSVICSQPCSSPPTPSSSCSTVLDGSSRPIAPWRSRPVTPTRACADTSSHRSFPSARPPRRSPTACGASPTARSPTPSRATG